jgi:hypothetical protein
VRINKRRTYLRAILDTEVAVGRTLRCAALDGVLVQTRPLAHQRPGIRAIRPATNALELVDLVHDRRRAHDLQCTLGIYRQEPRAATRLSRIARARLRALGVVRLGGLIVKPVAAVALTAVLDTSDGESELSASSRARRTGHVGGGAGILRERALSGVRVTAGVGEAVGGRRRRASGGRLSR